MRFLGLIFLLSAAACTSLSLEPGALPAGGVGHPYDQKILIKGAKTPVFDVSVSGKLPPGLELRYAEEAESFTIVGKPKKAGTYRFVVHVGCYGTNSAGQELAEKLEIKIGPN